MHDRFILHDVHVVAAMAVSHHACRHSRHPVIIVLEAMDAVVGSQGEEISGSGPDGAWLPKCVDTGEANVMVNQLRRCHDCHGTAQAVAG